MIVKETTLKVGTEKEQDNTQAVSEVYHKARGMLSCGERPQVSNYTSVLESESSAYPDIFFPLLSWSSPKSP